jgi:hypothetical protein
LTVFNLRATAFFLSLPEHHIGLIKPKATFFFVQISRTNRGTNGVTARRPHCCCELNTKAGAALTCA